MDHRILLLMQFIAQTSYLTLKELEVAAHVTRRQALYRINKLNDLLISENVPPITLDATSDKRIEVCEKTKNVIQKLLLEMQEDEPYYFSKAERLIYIYLMLFVNDDYLSLNHFIDALEVSRSTVLLDFKELSQMLAEKSVKIKYNRSKGYFLDGAEMEIRHIMMRYVISSLSGDRNEKIFDLIITDFGLVKFEKSKKIIENLAEKHNIRFVGERLIEFIYIYTFLRVRIQSGKDVSKEINCQMDISVMKSMKEYAFTRDLFEKYEGIENVSEADMQYVSSWILGISFGDIHEETKDVVLISDMVGKIMTRFESLSGIHYKNTEKIFKQLYSHFRPAYYRLIFKLPIFNPMCQKIKKEYAKLYQLVEETMKPFHVILGENIPDDEIAYLTMHFAVIFSGKNTEKIAKQKTALVVCLNGIGSSSILYNELTNMFPELHFYPPLEIGNINKYKDEVDIIFAAGNVSKMVHTDIPIVRVTPVMSIQERYQVIREVYMLLGSNSMKKPSADTVFGIVEKYADIKQENALYNELITYFSKLNYVEDRNGEMHLLDMVKEGIICLNVGAKNWEEAIRLAYKPMIEEKFITENYVEDTIQGVKMMGPYIVTTRHVALPHTKPEAGALKTGLGICVLKEAVPFGSKDNDPVKYIFSLSAIDNESHLSAMAELIELLGDKRFYDMLDHAKNTNEVLEYLKKKEK